MRPRFRLGLRTVKTALSVMLSLYLASLFGELSIFPALASISVMSRTFDEGLRECRNQAVGIFIGGLFGCLAAYLVPYPPIWVMALGVMLIIFVCASFHVGFSCSLSCAIFIVACMSEPADVVPSVLIRLFHTAIGLTTGLIINYSIVPYNNSKTIFSLVESLVSQLPELLDRRILQNDVLIITPLNEQKERLEYELTIYRHQRFLRKEQYRETYTAMSTCYQLTDQLLDELSVLNRLDCIGTLSEQNKQALRELGLLVPEELPEASCGQENRIVLNYHLQKLLEVREELLHILRECK